MKSIRRLIAAALVGIVAVAFAGCGDDDGDETGEGTSTSQTTPTPDAVALSASLSGEEEVPGPGVTDGVGTAEISFQGGQLCYDLSVTMGETPTAGHIHEGAKGAAGGVVVDLEPSFTAGESAFLDQDCVDIDPNVLSSLQDGPDGFYVNIHTAEHPDGAVRGQLVLKSGAGSGSEGGVDTTTSTEGSSSDGGLGY